MERDSWKATVKTEEAKQLIIDLILKVENFQPEECEFKNDGDTLIIRERLTERDIAYIKFQKYERRNSTSQNFIYQSAKIILGDSIAQERICGLKPETRGR